MSVKTEQRKMGVEEGIALLFHLNGCLNEYFVGNALFQNKNFCNSIQSIPFTVHIFPKDIFSHHFPPQFLTA